MIRDCLVSSFRNLGRKKFRSFLTIASIAIGVCSVVLIGSIGEIGKEADRAGAQFPWVGKCDSQRGQTFYILKNDQGRSVPSSRHPGGGKRDPNCGGFTATFECGDWSQILFFGGWIPAAAR